MEPHLNNQERRRNRIPMWSWIAGSVLLAIVLGWGFVELAGQLQGDRTLNSDHRTNQESGQTVTARQGPVVPKTNPSTGARPQNANENAREIDQGTAPLKLSDEQRQRR